MTEKEIRWKIRRLLMIVMLLLIIVCSPRKNIQAAKIPSKNIQVYFIDVGAGDAILIQYGNGTDAQYALIDAGPVYYTKTDGVTVDTSDYIRQYLKKKKITHLKFVLLTHPHQDHIGGMLKILDDPTIKIDTIYGNDQNMKVLQSSTDKEQQCAETAQMIIYRDEEGIYQAVLEKINQMVLEGRTKYVVPKADQKVYIGKAYLTFYGAFYTNYQYGRKGDLNYRQVNKTSIVSKLTYKKNTFLMTGDAQKDTINMLLKKGYNLKAEVLKVPHHGMQDIVTTKKDQRSDHELLFKNVKAQISIISNGYQNSYKAPHKKVMQDLSNTDVYDTGSRGTIIVKADGTKLSVQTEKGKGPSQKRVTTGPKSPKIIADCKGVKTLKLNQKYKKIVESKKEIKIKFKASYGVSGKKSVQYKLVPEGKNQKKYKWKSGEELKYKKNQKIRIYVCFTNHAGYKTIRRSNVIQIKTEKKKRREKK